MESDFVIVLNICACIPDKVIVLSSPGVTGSGVIDASRVFESCFDDLNRCRSSFNTRPSFPVPCISAMSMPSSFDKCRTAGVARVLILDAILFSGGWATAGSVVDCSSSNAVRSESTGSSDVELRMVWFSASICSAASSSTSISHSGCFY